MSDLRKANHKFRERWWVYHKLQNRQKEGRRLRSVENLQPSERRRIYGQKCNSEDEKWEMLKDRGGVGIRIVVGGKKETG